MANFNDIFLKQAAELALKTDYSVAMGLSASTVKLTSEADHLTEMDSCYAPDQ